MVDEMGKGWEIGLLFMCSIDGRLYSAVGGNDRWNVCCAMEFLGLIFLI